VPSPSFVVDERVIWIEVSGLPLCTWGSSAFKKIANLFGKFNFFDDDVEDSMCMGRACITTQIKSLISEKVNVTIKDLNFNVHVKEIVADNETLFSGKVKEEYFVTKEDKPSEEDVPDTSKPPGFENFIKENSECSISYNASRSSKCSTSFETKVTKLQLFQSRSMWGKFNFDYGCSMARGRSSGLVTMWDPNLFVKKRMRHPGKIILFGDLNEVRNDSERFGSIFSSGDAAIFNDFIQESGLIDLPMGGRSFT
nr:RNA-directed DNA polymerase, eukaryota, reverse transcriptase zinc-binding domain protein [Tanacetum cinerariifolium]